VNLSEQEREIIGECLKAVAYGPFFIDSKATDDPYWEISTLFGLTINELRMIADNWSKADMSCEKSRVAVNNCLVNLLGYPHGSSQEVWSKYISVSPDELERILQKWKRCGRVS
jgi:hypothetical protein